MIYTSFDGIKFPDKEWRDRYEKLMKDIEEHIEGENKMKLSNNMKQGRLKND